MNKTLTVAIWLITCLLSTTIGHAQSTVNELQTRTGFSASFSPASKLKFEIAPELRFEDQFTIDRAQIETEVSYEILKYLSFGARYRFIVNYRDNKDTEYLNRYMMSVTLKQKFDRWKPSLRISYTDYADDNDAAAIIRYKGGVSYNIKNCKLSPMMNIQAHQDITNSNWYKLRYAAGFDYKLFKNNEISLAYKLDYYLQEVRNRHILDICYKVKF